MASDYIHYVCYLGDEKQRAVTVTIRRGTSSQDVLFLLTKVMDTIRRGGDGQLHQPGVTEVRLMSSADAGKHTDDP